MKIAYFSDFFYPQIGGIQTSIMALGRELARRGNEVWFYVPRYSKEHYEISDVPETEPDLGPNVRIVRLPSLPFLLEARNRSRVVIPGPCQIRNIIRERPDVIHTQTFWLAGIEALIAGRFGSIPVIGTHHLAAAHYVQVREFYFKYVMWFYNHCDHVTAPSAWSFQEMTEHGFNRPHEVISNPIDTAIFNSVGKGKEELKKKYGLSKNTLVFVGRISGEKNLDVIVRALPLIKKEVPDIEFAIAGRGSDEELLRQMAESLGVGDRLKYLGMLGREAVAELDAAAEIFVVTSTSETQNMVMLEAMAAGVPVIAARAQALPEYVPAEAGLLIEPGNHEALAKEAVTLLKDPKRRAVLGAGGRKYVERFSVTNIADQWEGIYKKVMDNHKRAQAGNGG
jgi:1,2-diacylglycerol 3-alpha-glucosyltransferase